MVPVEEKKAIISGAETFLQVHKISVERVFLLLMRKNKATKQEITLSRPARTCRGIITTRREGP